MGAKEDLGTDKGVEGKGKEEDLALIPVAEGIQPVVRKIVKKVDNNEFVDFADLLQDQFAYEQDLSLPAAQSGLVLVQSLESLRKKKKKITDFQSWVEALMVFVAIKYRNANPEVSNIMAYGVVMSQTAREHSLERWTMYDRKYRESAGAKKEVSWNLLNSNLWNRCFSGHPKSSGVKVCSMCTLSGHAAWECPDRVFIRNPPLGRGFCIQAKQMTATFSVTPTITKVYVTGVTSVHLFISALVAGRITLRYCVGARGGLRKEIISPEKGQPDSCIVLRNVIYLFNHY